MFRAVIFAVFVAVVTGLTVSPATEKESNESTEINDKDFEVDAISGILTENYDTGTFFLDPTDPTAKSMGNAIKTFNKFHRALQLIVRITTPCLIDREVNPYIKKKAKIDFHRQKMESAWLRGVVGHRRKMIEVHEKLWHVYQKIQKNQEVGLQELEVMKSSADGLVESEERLRKKTLRLILNVLGK